MVFGKKGIVACAMPPTHCENDRKKSIADGDRGFLRVAFYGDTEN